MSRYLIFVKACKNIYITFIYVSLDTYQSSIYV